MCGSTSDSRRTRVAGMSIVMAPRAPDGVRPFTDDLSGESLGAPGVPLPKNNPGRGRSMAIRCI
jgi:hypothetical protein